MIVFINGSVKAISRDNLCSHNVVDTKSSVVCHRSVTSAHRPPCDSDGSDPSRRHGFSALRRCLLEFTPDASRSNDDVLLSRSIGVVFESDAFDERRSNHHPVFTRMTIQKVVSSARHCHTKIVLHREIHGRHNMVGVQSEDNKGWLRSRSRVVSGGSQTDLTGLPLFDVFSWL